MKKKFIVLLLTFFASFNVMMSQIPLNGSLIVMNEKVVIPIGEQGSTPKSPPSQINIYLYNNILYFGISLAGCPVYLIGDNEIVFSSFVNTDGVVVLPTGITGTFELQLIIGDVYYFAELIFTDE